MLVMEQYLNNPGLIAGLILGNALIAAFILLLLDKLGAFIWLQIHGSEIVAQLAKCWFCLSFWMNVLIIIMLWIVYGNYFLFLVPIFSTPITRKLL